MGYTKEIESKLIRVVHKIDFKLEGTRAIDIKQILNRVPDEAKLTEVIENVDDGDIIGCELWFEEEKEDNSVSS